MTKRQIEMCKRIYKKHKSTYKKVKMMCFLFNGKNLIDFGINSNDTDPIQTKYGIIYRRKINNKSYYLDKRHAEIDCLKKYIENKDINMNKLSIFILSLKEDGTYRCSKPCPVCQEFLNDIGIGEICYVNDYNRIVSEKLI